MGLTIHYELRSRVRTAAQAKRLISELHAAACDLPFASVEPLVEHVASPGEDEDFPAGFYHATGLVVRREAMREVHVRRLVAFRVHPAAGSESAEFGLARYPRQAGWSWKAFCKTQYASAPQHGGVVNFLRCHTALIRLLDIAQSLGLEVAVSDEGRFWEERSVEKLAREIGEWNELIAGFGGQLKDALGGTVSGPIFKFPNFEHLEARGRK